MPTFALALAIGAVLPLTAAANHAEPTFPLTASIVEGISDCAPPPPDNGTAIPTGQAGNATTPPDRNNTSSSNEHTPGTVQDLVIHANAESDPKENTLDISGSHNVLDGLVNSRSHLKISGSWNLLRHGTDYGQRSEQGKVAFDLTGSNNCFSPIPTQTYENAPPESPAGFPLFSAFDPDQDGNVLEHFMPGSIAANAAMADPAPGAQYFVCGIADPDGAGTAAATAPGCSGSGANAIMDRNVQGQTLESGLYFVTGRVKISASSVPNATVTIVSGLQLNVNGSVQGNVVNVFNPYTDATGKRPGDLLFASQYDEAAPLSGPTFPDGSTSSDSPNTDKAEDALKVEGSLSRFEGIIVATNGRTELAGEQLDFRCPVMGDRVRLNGSKNYFNAAGCVAGPGLQVSKTPDGNVTVNAGDNATFTITVTNAGSGPANNVDLDDVFPGTGWTLISALKQGAALPAGDSCTLTGGNTLHCDVAVLGPGENLVVVVQRATTTADCANDTGTGIRLDNGSLTPDPLDDALADADNNPQVNDPGHIIVRCPDASVSKTPDNGTVNAGSTATFTIRVTANGPGTSFNVKLDDPPLPNNPPFLPDSGFTWTLGGTNSASCTLTGASGAQILHCEFGNITAGDFREITLSTPTDASDCGKGLITNPVRISGDGDTNATNNNDTGSLTVICSAIRINKDSTKGGPVLVAGATFTISPHPTGAASTFTVIDNGTNDADPVTGEICVTPVAPGVLYTITETVAPTGYGLPADVTETTTPAAGGTCASGAGTVTFLDPPLADIQVRFDSQVPGEASLTVPLSCTVPNSSGTSSTAATADWDNTLTITGIRVLPSPQIVQCTINIDP